MLRGSWAGVSAVVLAGLLASAAEAATITYYYVSAPYEVSNYEDRATRPIHTVGSVTIDTAKLDGSGGLANRTINGQQSDEPDASYWPAAVTQIGFSNQSGTSFTVGGVDWNFMRFDEESQLVEWVLEDVEYLGDPESAFSTYSGGPDKLSGALQLLPWEPDWDIFDYDLRVGAFLQTRGYRPGSSTYEALFADDTMWRYLTHASGSGHWFDNLTDFARQIEANALYAAVNPPRSFYDIAPVPLPLPAAMLLVGILGSGVAVWGSRRVNTKL